MKAEIKIRIVSYGNKNHYSIEFWERKFWFLGKWISFGSLGCNRLLDFTLTDIQKWEIVEFLRKHIKKTDIVKENCRYIF